MHINMKNSYEDYLNFTARYILLSIKNTLDSKGSASISMPTDQATHDIYKRLTLLLKDYKIDFQKVKVFQQIEYVGLSSTHHRSMSQFLKRNFLSPLNISDENIFLLDGAGDDAQMESQEAAIEQLGGLDMIWYSLNANGSIAGNEPCSSISATYRLKTLSSRSKEDAASLFKQKKQFVPSRVFSMGMGIAGLAKRIILTASGLECSVALKMAIEGGLGHSSQASILQMHKNVNVIIDSEAALRLSKTSYFTAEEGEE